MIKYYSNLLPEILKYLIIGALGYIGALMIPPGDLYDWIRRQDPNELSGTWYGAIAGSPSILELEDHGELLSGNLKYLAGFPNEKNIKIKGNHDGHIVLQGDWSNNEKIKISLMRKLGGRFGADDQYLLLISDDDKPPVYICKSNIMNMSDSGECSKLEGGLTIFARTSKS